MNDEIEELHQQVFEKELAAGVPSSLPLRSYLEFAWRRAEEWYRAKDLDEKEWQSPIFEFCRYAKAHPALENCDQYAALEMVEKEWLRDEQWSDQFHALDDDEAQLQFLTCWPQVRFLPGIDPLEMALRAAQKHLVAVKLPNGRRTKMKLFALIVNIAARLRELLGEYRIFLPCHKLSKKLGCSHMRVARALRVAIDTGFLQVEKEFPYHGPGTQARVFQFVGAYNPEEDCLEGDQHRAATIAEGTQPEPTNEGGGGYRNIQRHAPWLKLPRSD